MYSHFEMCQQMPVFKTYAPPHVSFGALLAVCDKMPWLENAMPQSSFLSGKPQKHSNTTA
jgi:hypothetical protein